MTSIRPLDQQDAKRSFGRGGPVTFVLSDSAIDALKARSDRDLLGAITLHPLAPAEPVAEEWLKDAGVLVIEVAADDPASLERIALVRRQHPELPLIAALGETSVASSRALLRQGVNDIAGLPIDCTELALQLAELGDGEFEVRKGRLARLIMVAGSTGGCGATTVVTHLAAALARKEEHSREVCVLDLDLQAGEVAHYVGQVPRVSVTTLLDAGDRLDAALLRSALTDSHQGFGIIAAPDVITALEDVNQDRLLELLSLARTMFDIVLVDAPNDWSNWSLSLALSADQLVLVTELSVAGLRQARKRLDLFASVGVNMDRVRVVANRTEHSFFKAIGLKDAAKALGRDVAIAISDEAEEMVAAQNEGRLLTDLHKHSRFGAEIRQLADLLDGEGR